MRPRWKAEVHRALPSDASVVPSALSDSEMSSFGAKFGSCALLQLSQKMPFSPRLQTIVCALQRAIYTRRCVITAGMTVDGYVPLTTPTSNKTGAFDIAAEISHAVYNAKVVVYVISKTGERVYGSVLPIQAIRSRCVCAEDGIQVHGAAEKLVWRDAINQLPQTTEEAIAQQSPASVLSEAGRVIDAAAVKFFDGRSDVYSRACTTPQLDPKLGHKLRLAVAIVYGGKITWSNVMSLICNGAALCGILSSADVQMLANVAIAAVANDVGALDAVCTVPLKRVICKVKLPLHQKLALFPSGACVNAVMAAVCKTPVYEINAKLYGMLGSTFSAPWRSPFGGGTGSHCLDTVADACSASGCIQTPVWSWEAAAVIADSFYSPPRSFHRRHVVVVIFLCSLHGVSVIVGVHVFCKNKCNDYVAVKINTAWPLSTNTTGVIFKCKTSKCPKEQRVSVMYKNQTLVINGHSVVHGSVIEDAVT